LRRSPALIDSIAWFGLPQPSTVTLALFQALAAWCKTAARKSLIAHLGQGEALILRDHGALTVGRTVGEVFSWMLCIELSARAPLGGDGLQGAADRSAAELPPRNASFELWAKVGRFGYRLRTVPEAGMTAVSEPTRTKRAFVVRSPFQSGKIRAIHNFPKLRQRGLGCGSPHS
jgi:Class II Aldolase and Adducin N-terminal domain